MLIETSCYSAGRFLFTGITLNLRPTTSPSFPLTSSGLRPPSPKGEGKLKQDKFEREARQGRCNQLGINASSVE
jgi:hypothetical protein